MSLLGSIGRLRRRLPGWFAPAAAPAGFPAAGPRLIVTLAADYPNLGDVALTRATLAFCAAQLPAHRPFVIPAHRTLASLRGAARHAGPDDVVVLVGGGNLGDRYRRLEELRCAVIRAFPRQRVIAFPQSCEWSDTARGRDALGHSRRTYAAHPNLALFARDHASHARLRADFPGCRVALAPDTALWLRPTAATGDAPPLLCLRRDGESDLGDDRRGRLVADLAAAWPGAQVADTTASGTDSLDRQLDDLLGRFASARLVVTDRLHGLVFARIHRRPCVAIEGANDKLRALAETWFPGAADLRVLRRPDAAAVLAAAEAALSAAPSPPLGPEAFAGLARAVRGDA